MAAIDDVIAWANTIPAWQGDAVRRLLRAGDIELSVQDYSEVLSLAKSELGLAPLPAGLSAIPPASGMFSGAPAARTALKLISISDIHNVNILESGQTLPFAENGITVIYGDNGAGKSGYSRILKLACQARDKDERIIPNVFAPVTGSANALLEVKEGNASRTIRWTQGTDPDPILTNISVFDGRCSRVITDEQNEITYLPYGCDVFPKLAKLVTKVKIDIESGVVTSPTVQDNAVLEGTPSAAFLRALSASTTDQDIDAATTWTLIDEQLLAEKLELARTSEPKNALEEVKQLEQFGKRVSGAVSNATDLFAACSLLTNNAVDSVINELQSAKEARSVAASMRQSTDPLPGVASTNQWEILYQAAKKYSEEVAYLGDTFPKIPDALCVLCQQPLSVAASDRFARFKIYMEDTTSTVLAAKRAALRSMHSKVESLGCYAGAVSFEAFCDQVATYDANAGESIRSFHAAIALRKTAMLGMLDESGNSLDSSSMPPWPHSPATSLEGVVNTIAQKAATITKAAKPEEYQKLLTLVSHLNSRKALSLRKADVVKYVNRMKHDLAISHAITTIGTTRDITRHGTALIKNHLTPELANALKDELDRLGASKLPISVKPTGGSGETTHKMLLVDATVSALTSQVLSEGEARVIGIAGFLAELQLAPNGNAIVLDDPVSSLDHNFVVKIASRLATEALARQVIIFTHNISFLTELEDACKNLALEGTSAEFAVHTLRSDNRTSGISTNGAPWYNLSVKGRAHYLDQCVNEIKPLYLVDSPKYNKEAAHIYGLLRESWEACIEVDLFYSVVCRYRNSIQISKLDEVAIEDSDVHCFERNYSNASRWMTGHDKALKTNYPSPQDILSDINALREFSASIRKRYDKTKKERKSKLAPQTVAVGIPTVADNPATVQSLPQARAGTRHA